MTATLIVLAEFRARQQRLLRPLTAPHHAAALTRVACEYTFWPLLVVCAAIDGYAVAHKAVLRRIP